MKISCECGGLISDVTDGLSFKARIIPDQEYFELMDLIDAAVERDWQPGENREKVCMSIRSKMSQVTRIAWRCGNCGRIHIEDRAHQLHAFAPTDGSRGVEIFRSRPS